MWLYDEIHGTQSKASSITNRRNSTTTGVKTMSKINKLQKEVDQALRKCSTDFEIGVCSHYLNKDLEQLGYTLSVYDKVIPLEKKL